MTSTTGSADAQPAPIVVLFVCMGNICRSPTAHGVFRALVERAGLSDRVQVRSAGTHGYHIGDPPDERAVRHARRRGYDLSDLRAAHLSAADVQRADVIAVMDDANRAAVLTLCAAPDRAKVRLLTEHGRTHRATHVPDPYDGDAQGFEQVLDLVEDACAGLLEDVRRRWGV